MCFVVDSCWFNSVYLFIFPTPTIMSCFLILQMGSPGYYRKFSCLNVGCHGSLVRDDWFLLLNCKEKCIPCFRQGWEKEEEKEKGSRRNDVHELVMHKGSGVQGI